MPREYGNLLANMRNQAIRALEQSIFSKFFLTELWKLEIEAY